MPELGEADSLVAYSEHVADCLACDPGSARMCSVGQKLHRRWRAAAVRQAAP